MLRSKYLNAPADSRSARSAVRALASRPVSSSAWRPPIRFSDAAALATAIAVLSSTPTAHALTTCISLQPPVDVELPLSQQGTVQGPIPVADLSVGHFGDGGDIIDERDPITPFTLYGTSFKKFLIEQLQGEKVVSRRKGFTVEACVGAVEVTQESPQFQGLSTRAKALYAKDSICKKSEGQELRGTCRVACEAACGEAVAGYARQVTSESGFALLPADTARLARSCARSCTYECGKPGSSFDFAVPYRR